MDFLKGKTITNVENIGVLDFYNDEEYVTEVYKLTCSDGKEIYVSSEAGDVSGAYCQIYKLDDKSISKIKKHI